MQEQQKRLIWLFQELFLAKSPIGEIHASTHEVRLLTGHHPLPNKTRENSLAAREECPGDRIWWA